jgi:hypothetical protein
VDEIALRAASTEFSEVRGQSDVSNILQDGGKT